MSKLYRVDDDDDDDDDGGGGRHWLGDRKCTQLPQQLPRVTSETAIT